MIRNLYTTLECVKFLLHTYICIYYSKSTQADVIPGIASDVRISLRIPVYDHTAPGGVVIYIPMYYKIPGLYSIIDLDFCFNFSVYISLFFCLFLLYVIFILKKSVLSYLTVFHYLYWKTYHFYANDSQKNTYI